MGLNGPALRRVLVAGSLNADPTTHAFCVRYVSRRCCGDGTQHWAGTGARAILRLGETTQPAPHQGAVPLPSPGHNTRRDMNPQAVLSQAAEAGSIPSSSSSKASGSDNLALRIKDKTVLCGELAKRVCLQYALPALCVDSSRSRCLWHAGIEKAMAP